MTSRERVEAVMTLEVPDRVPIGDGLFQHWGFINHYCETKQKGKWTLEEICRGVGNSKVDYAFDIAPSLEPHREMRLGLTYEVTEWTEVVVDRPFRTVDEAKKVLVNLGLSTASSADYQAWLATQKEKQATAQGWPHEQGKKSGRCEPNSSFGNI